MKNDCEIFSLIFYLFYHVILFLDADDEDLEERRAITYQMSKNKGLQPKRKKEQRNPRVKHRKKFEKAKVRRKGKFKNGILFPKLF